MADLSESTLDGRFVANVGDDNVPDATPSFDGSASVLSARSSSTAHDDCDLGTRLGKARQRSPRRCPNPRPLRKQPGRLTRRFDLSLNYAIARRCCQPRFAGYVDGRAEQNNILNEELTDHAEKRKCVIGRVECHRGRRK